MTAGAGCLDACRAVPTLRSAGMVHVTVSGSVAPSGTKQLYEVRPPGPCGPATVAVYRRRLRNLSVPTSRLGKTASSIPQGGDGRRQARSGGIETSVSSGRLPSAASASVRVHSVVGPHRWARVQRGRSVSSQAGAGARANPKPTGSGVCRTATRGSVSQKNVALSRSPGVPQLAVQLLGRAGVSAGGCHHFLLLRGEMGPAHGAGPCRRPWAVPISSSSGGKGDRHTALNH